MAFLTVFAGPNGSGKSSIIRHSGFEGRQNLLDTDGIAKRINPFDPAYAALKAGREVIRRMREYIDTQQSFALETTLSGGRTILAIRLACERQFIVRIIYVCLDDSSLNIDRVRERFAKGGHDVPDEDIRRRYTRSLANLVTVVGFVHEVIGYDNSGQELRKVLEYQRGVLTWRASALPEWAKKLVALTE